ncbi:GATA zinc finger domain-containing protein 10 [Eurosta solidaginis]|uniref:GATA zinc finger domain-containing protein 10 n=1 Tax=Eurosta solidaginis TaxID=178769 RepID=UPI003530DED0
MHWKPATVAAIKSTNSGTLENKEAQRQIRMAAATRANSNDENAESSGGSGTRANSTNSNSNNNNNYSNNNNNDDSTTSQNLSAVQMDEAELKLKRQTLEQRKQELERELSEKNWLLQQIQKQETQIINGNYEYVNVNEIFAMLARQYKKEYGGGGGTEGGGAGGGSMGGGSTAILRRKTISGNSYKENQINTNNNNNNMSSNNNRQSEISNRSSEYDNYPGANATIGDCNVSILSGGPPQQQQQLQKSQSLKKRSASTVTSAISTMGNYNYLQVAQQQHQRQQQQQQQQLLQQQMLQNHMQYNALLQHQHYHQQQQQMHLQQAFEGQQQQLQHQQQQIQQQQQQLQQQQLKQQLQQQQYQQYKQQQQSQHSPSHAHTQSRHYPADAISLYSVNSANVATLRQQHIAPQQQPIVVQCDRYYLSPTHQSYNDGGFIKSSQNIKKYISPQASPTHHQQQQQQQHVHKEAYMYQQDLLMPTGGAVTEQKYQQQLQQQQQQHHQLSQQQQLHLPTQSEQQFFTLTPLSPQILLHSPQQQHNTTNRQLDAISLAPSYISVDVDNISSTAAHNSRWRSQGTLPPISPLTSPQHHSNNYNSTSQISSDIKSQSSDMLSSNAYYNTSAALPSASIKSLTKPPDEISISSLNSETQTKSKQPKAKQWMESSLDGPVIRPTSASSGGSKAATHAQDLQRNGSSSAARASGNKTSAAGAPMLGSGFTSIGSGGISTVSGIVGIVVPPTAAPRERTKLSSQSMSAGATRHYSMSAASHKHPYAQAKMLQDDDGRYAKLSQSTSYLNSQRESPSISAAYPLDCSSSNTTIELPTPSSGVFKYLPPKPSNTTNASQLTPPPPPRPPPMAEKVLGVCVVGVVATPSALSPTDIRIESPKNITIVKPATFRPYQEETKPFEMSDFYKYSTKFRQKDTSGAANAEH